MGLDLSPERDSESTFGCFGIACPEEWFEIESPEGGCGTVSPERDFGIVSPLVTCETESPEGRWIYICPERLSEAFGLKVLKSGLRLNLFRDTVGLSVLD